MPTDGATFNNPQSSPLPNYPLTIWPPEGSGVSSCEPTDMCPAFSRNKLFGGIMKWKLLSLLFPLPAFLLLPCLLGSRPAGAVE